MTGRNQSIAIEIGTGAVPREKQAECRFSELDKEPQALVASTVSDARTLSSKAVAGLIAGVALLWSLFQLWIAPPQFWAASYLTEMGIPGHVVVFNSTQARPLHLAFAILLVFLVYPAFKKSPRNYVPITDWVLAIVGAACAAYVSIFADHLLETARIGLPSTFQIVLGAIGILVLLEASRRTIGLRFITIASSLSLLYLYYGSGLLIPALVEHAGFSLEVIISVQWFEVFGVFGIPLGISTAFLFLFVLFGSLLGAPKKGGNVIDKGKNFLGLVSRPQNVLPTLVLIWALYFEKLSPPKSAFFAVTLLLLIIVIKKPIKAFFEGSGDFTDQFVEGIVDVYQGLVRGARNMIKVSVATATAGIIVATVTKTPLGIELAGLIEVLSGG